MWRVDCCCCLATQLYLTLCDPMDCSPSGSSVCGISQARMQEWLSFPTPRGLSNLGIEPMSPTLAGGFFTTQPLGKLEGRLQGSY